MQITSAKARLAYGVSLAAMMSIAGAVGASAQQQPSAQPQPQTGAQPEIKVQQPAPEITVKQPPPQVTVEQPKPNVQVEQQGQPKVQVQQGGQQGAQPGQQGAQQQAQPKSQTQLSSMGRGIVGKYVYGSNNENLGEVSDVVMGPNNQVQSALIDVGGFLGIGERRVALAISDLRLEGDRLVSLLTKQQVEQLPEYKASGRGAGRND